MFNKHILSILSVLSPLALSSPTPSLFTRQESPNHYFAITFINAAFSRHKAAPTTGSRYQNFEIYDVPDITTWPANATNPADGGTIPYKGTNCTTHWEVPEYGPNANKSYPANCEDPNWTWYFTEDSPPSNDSIGDGWSGGYHLNVYFKDVDETTSESLVWYVNDILVSKEAVAPRQYNRGCALSGAGCSSSFQNYTDPYAVGPVKKL